MSPRPVPKGYSTLQIALHWLVAVLILLQFLLADWMSAAWRVVRTGGTPGFDPLVTSHVIGGFAILALVLWRLALRWTRGVPDLPPAGSRLQHLAAHLGHYGLYAVMIVLVLSGAVAWFGGLDAAAEVHELVKPLLIALVAVHVLAALWHQFWLKDGLLLRMKRPG